MIRSMDTLQHNFSILQKKQEMVSTNIANVNTPGYEALKMVQSTDGQVALINHLGGPERNQQTGLGGLALQNQVDEVYTLDEVNMADEMVELMKIAREFESNQKALHASDETLRKASNELGRV